MTKARKKLSLMTTLVALIILLSGSAGNDGDSFIGFLKKKVSDYNKNYPSEKAYVFTDRYIYKPGEDLWFQCFVISVPGKREVIHSEDIFIKLINLKGEEIAFRRYPLNDQMASGRLFLPRTIIPGKYYLVAYTGWMKNQCVNEAYRKEILISKYFDKRFQVKVIFNKPDYFAGDSITAAFSLLDYLGKPLGAVDYDYNIGTLDKSLVKGSGTTDIRGSSKIRDLLPNAEDLLFLNFEFKSRKAGNYSVLIPAALRAPEIQFYPEGNSLVKGIPSKMAVKSTNHYGLPSYFEGNLVDDHGIILEKVKTNQKGIGVFSYTPGQDTVYLQITKPLNVDKMYTLPMPENHGIVMNLTDIGKDTARFQLNSDNDTSSTGVYLIAICEREIIWSKYLEFKQSTEVKVPIDKVTGRIVQVSVFNTDHRLIAERLINPDFKSETLTIQSDKNLYHKRQRVVLTINLTGISIRNDIAISVSQKHLANHPLMQNIDELLTPGVCDTLKTFPCNIFESNDLELMTSDYRIISWNNLLDDNLAALPYTKQDGVTGFVFDKKDNPVQLAKVRATHIPNYKLYETQTDEKGNFRILFGPDIIDFNYLNINAFDASGKTNLHAQVDYSYSRMLNHVILPGKENNERQKIFDIIEYGDPELIYALRYGPVKQIHPEKIIHKKYNPNTYAGYTSLLDILMDLQPYDLKNNRIVFRDIRQGISYQDVPEGALIVVDGIPRGIDASLLNTYSPSDITAINILTTPSEIHQYTPLNPQAVIEISTIQGLYRYRQQSLPPVTDILNPNREFYSPDYSLVQDTKPDNRKTLYWNPHVVVMPNKPVIIIFYTSDLEGTYYGRAEGFDDEGNPVSAEFTFEVVE